VEEETYFDLCECFFERVFVAAAKMVPGQKVDVNEKQCSERFRARYVPSSTGTEPDDVVMNYRYCPVHLRMYACMLATVGAAAAAAAAAAPVPVPAVAPLDAHLTPPTHTLSVYMFMYIALAPARGHVDVAATSWCSGWAAWTSMRPGRACPPCCGGTST